MPEPVDLGDTVRLMLEGCAISEATLRCTITWAGGEYPCSATPETGGKIMNEGGLSPMMRTKARVSIKVRNEVFPSGVGFPQEKQTLLYKRSQNSTPVLYRIDTIVNYYDAILELQCNLPSEGA